MTTRSAFRFLIAGLVLASTTLLTGCGGGDSDTIKVGEYGSMSGDEATFGQSTHKGIMLAVKEFNAAGGLKGKKIDVIAEDDQGKSEEVGKVVKKLIESDKVVALLGEVASSLSIAGGRLAQEKSIPMISPSSTNPKVTEGGDMIFRVCFTDDFQGYAMAKFAKENLKAETAAIFYDQKSAYSTGLRDFIETEFTKMGGKVLTKQAYSAGDSDFSAQLATIRDLKPDVLFIPGYYTHAGNIAIQARRLSITATLVGGDGWDSSKLAEVGGKAIEGQYFTNHCSYEDPGPKAFKEKYMAEYKGEVPDALAALGYDSAKLLFDAMTRSPSLSGKDLAKAISETKNLDGVTGKTTIDAKRNASKAIVVIQVKDGKLIPVASFPPRTEQHVTKLLQTLMDGVTVGSLYALIALGYTMVYGILKFINFAHGDVFMLGAWIAFVIAKAMGYAAPDAQAPWYAAVLILLLSMAACGALGFCIERLAYRPLRGAPRLNVLITAIGVSLLLENAGQLPFLFGTQPQRMPSLLPDRELFAIGRDLDQQIPGVAVRLVDVIGFATTVILMLAMEWLVFRTKLGLAMRAISHDPKTASLMGVPVDRVISFTFVVGSALAAAAGFLYAMKYPGINQPANTAWILLGLKAFVAAVVGGIGNIRGAILGGLLIGMIEQGGAAYINSNLRDVYVFTLLIIVLLVKPTGILGKTTLEKV